MEVIEALRTSIQEPRDHLHIKQIRAARRAERLFASCVVLLLTGSDRMCLRLVERVQGGSRRCPAAWVCEKYMEGA